MVLTHEQQVNKLTKNLSITVGDKMSELYQDNVRQHPVKTDIVPTMKTLHSKLVNDEDFYNKFTHVILNIINLNMYN